MKKVKPRTIYEVAYSRNRSFRETGTIMRLCTSWAIAVEVLDGETISVEQFVKWVTPEQSRATTHRQLQVWRAAFPEENTPDRMIRANLREQEKKSVNTMLALVA